MKITEWDPLFQEYVLLVIKKIQSDELSATFSDFTHYLVSHIQTMPAWQIALPVIACLAAGGSIDDGVVLASAWASLNLASEILDNVEDQELTTDQFLTSPEVASNFATSLIFSSFHLLTSIQDTNKAYGLVKILSSCGFDAAYGQHRDLISEQLPVELCLNNYWENIILKSGSIFQAATASGAIVAGANETISEALGDYGTALGVLLQLIDDCRDAFSQSSDAINWEISLTLLLYLMTVGKENIVFPNIGSRTEWSNSLQEAGVIRAISELLLQWKTRALESLSSLPQSREKQILERIPTLFLERIPSIANEVIDENNI
jgi:hypothetical protein